MQSLAVWEPNEFQELMGYRVPTQIQCESCGKCTPDIREMIFSSRDGEVLLCRKLVSTGQVFLFRKESFPVCSVEVADLLSSCGDFTLFPNES